MKNSRWRRLQSQPYCGHAVMIKTKRLGSDGSLDRVLQSITGDDLINQNEVLTVGF